LNLAIQDTANLNEVEELILESYRRFALKRMFKQMDQTQAFAFRPLGYLHGSTRAESPARQQGALFCSSYPTRYHQRFSL
jgi:hypothetical protein